MRERVYWIDIAKAFAILGVLIDHTRNVLYTDVRIAFLSYFSVGLFVFLMGITNYWSLLRVKGALGKSTARRCWKLFGPYMTATFVYSVFIDRALIFDNYVVRIIHFSASGPLYFVLLYIQLIAISPILFVLMKSLDGPGKHIYEILLLLCVTGIAFLTTNYTQIMDVYGGGGVLFGGTYLILFYCGMWLGKYHSTIIERMSGKVVSWLVFILGICATVCWWLFISRDQLGIDQRVPFGNGFNPPSVSFMVYALLLALVLFSTELTLRGSNPSVARVKKALGFLGRHTLYIFMYHRLFLDFVMEPFMAASGIDPANRLVKIVVCFCFMIGGPILIEVAHSAIQRFYRGLTAKISTE